MIELTHRLRVVVARAATEFPRLPLVARRLLRLCDGTRPVSALLGSSALPADQTRRVLERLLALGLITQSGEPRAARAPLSPMVLAWLNDQPLAFSDEEEQFFGSSIDHLVEEA
jgi:hypothetical protein